MVDADSVVANEMSSAKQRAKRNSDGQQPTVASSSFPARNIAPETIYADALLVWMIHVISSSIDGYYSVVQLSGQSIGPIYSNGSSFRSVLEASYLAKRFESVSCGGVRVRPACILDRVRPTLYKYTCRVNRQTFLRLFMGQLR